jgi:hypothetical protein
VLPEEEEDRGDGVNWLGEICVGGGPWRDEGTVVIEPLDGADQFCEGVDRTDEP